MPNSSKDYQVGRINFAPNSTWTTSSQDISLSKRQQNVTFDVPIAQDPEFHVRFLLNYLLRLSMKHHGSDDAPSRCICSESRCSIHRLLRLLGISSVSNTRFYLQQMESYLENTSTPSNRSTKSSGRTKKKSKFRKN